MRSRSRSTRKVRQSSRPVSQADEIPAAARADQPVRLDRAGAGWCRRGCGSRSAGSARSRQAAAMAVTACPRRRWAGLASGTVTDCRALTRWRSRAGSTCSSLASARSEVSSMPAMRPCAAVRSPTATATASSSSSSSGGRSRRRRAGTRPSRRWRARGIRARAAGPCRGGRCGPSHAQPLGELGAGPVASGLQEGQQFAAAGPRFPTCPQYPAQPRTEAVLTGPSVVDMRQRHSALSPSTSRRPTWTTSASAWPGPAGRTSWPAPAGRTACPSRTPGDWPTTGGTATTGARTRRR